MPSVNSAVLSAMAPSANVEAAASSSALSQAGGSSESLASEPAPFFANTPVKAAARPLTNSAVFFSKPAPMFGDDIGCRITDAGACERIGFLHRGAEVGVLPFLDATMRQSQGCECPDRLEPQLAQPFAARQSCFRVGELLTERGFGLVFNT